jgi:hypothetical protein
VRQKVLFCLTVPMTAYRFTTEHSSITQRSASAFELSELDSRKIKYCRQPDIYGGVKSEQLKVSYCVLWEDSSCVQYECTSDEEQTQ